jgi:ribulose kinase/pentose-5-phosphate-3-epimerase
MFRRYYNIAAINAYVATTSILINFLLAHYNIRLIYCIPSIEPIQLTPYSSDKYATPLVGHQRQQQHRQKLVLGIDGGTESIRACFFDANSGQVVGTSCSSSYTTYHPNPRWAEQDPDEWWQCCGIAVRQAIASLNNNNTNNTNNNSTNTMIDSSEIDRNKNINNNLQSYEICAITIDTTCCSVVALDKNMDPLRKCLLWMDQRSALQTQQIIQQCYGDPAITINGNGDGPISAEWMTPKAMWIQQNEPQIWDQACTICEYQDYMNYKLTNIMCASSCNAVTRWHWDGTKCCTAKNENDIDDNISDDSVRFPGRPLSLYKKLGIYDIIHKLPSKCVPMGTQIGLLTNDAADHLGLLPNIPVIQGGPDAFVGMIGLGCIESGQLCLITGSSHLHCVVTSKPNTASGIWGAYRNAPIQSLNFAEGGQSSTGSILRWAKRLFGGIDANSNTADISSSNSDVTYKVLDAEAEMIDPGADGLVALETFQGSRTPVTDPFARGALIGLTLSHTRGHIWRALLESVCYGTRACIEGLAAAGHTCDEIIIAGGVTRSDMWLQMHADITGKIVTVCENSDAPLLGCAILASAGVGIYKNVPDAVKAMVRTSKHIHPNMSKTHEYDSLYRTAYTKMLPTVQPIVHAIHNLRGGSSQEELFVPFNDDVDSTTIFNESKSNDIYKSARHDEKSIIISPSILACDWSNIEKEVHRCCTCTIGNKNQPLRLHIDIFDGVYLNSPNAFTFGPQMVVAIRNSIQSYLNIMERSQHQQSTNKMNTPTIIMDLHMCVDRPERFVQTLLNITTPYIDCCFIFQWEALANNTKNAQALIQQIINNGMKCGISINPSTNIKEIYPLLLQSNDDTNSNRINVINVLCVEPGFGGQAFQSNIALQKVEALQQFRNHNQQCNFQIMVDGGINNVTCRNVCDVGADIAVVGTFLFQHIDLIDGIKALQQCLQ